jgi:uncharacterized protein (TIGR00730 family)
LERHDTVKLNSAYYQSGRNIEEDINMKNKNSNNEKKNLLLKAYDNYEFLHSPAAREIRVLTEMIEPASRFRKYNMWNTVVFFGSARTLPMKTARKNHTELEKKIKSKSRLTAKLKGERERAKRDIIMARYYEDAKDLSGKLTLWFNELREIKKNFLVCTGGGPGIMEAANRGAKMVKGESVGLNISLPFEQYPNPYQTKEFSFEFHYFFIRKFWFFYLAKALVVFPGGFGTLDEFFELLTIIQTKKTQKFMPVVLYGSEYWDRVFNIEEMAKWGTISPKDLKLFRKFDDVDSAFAFLKEEITTHHLVDKRKKK